MWSLKSNSFQFIFIWLLFLQLNPDTTQAQENLKNQVGTWFIVAGDNALGDHWSIPIVGIWRQYNYAQETEFGFLRTGLNYRLSKQWYVGTGVAFLDTHHFEHPNNLEEKSQFWWYQEAGVKHTSTFTQRFRVENRWLNGPNGKSFRTRFRHRLQYKKPFTTTTYFKVSNESFFEFKELDFLQNRFFVGVGKAVHPNVCLEIGYLKNHVNGENYDRIRVAIYFKTRIAKKTVDLVNNTP